VHDEDVLESVSISSCCCCCCSCKHLEYHLPSVPYLKDNQQQRKTPEPTKKRPTEEVQLVTTENRLSFDQRENHDDTDDEDSEFEDYEEEIAGADNEEECDLNKGELEEEIKLLAEDLEKDCTMGTFSIRGNFLNGIPYIWFDRQQERCSVDYQLHSGTAGWQLTSKVDPSGRYLETEYTPPESFYNEKRLLLTNKNRSKSRKLHINHSKVSGLHQAILEYKARFPNETVVLTDVVKLPIKVETGLCTTDLPEGCEIYPVLNEDPDLAADGQNYLIYSVDLISVMKPKKARVATYHPSFLGSPLNINDDGEEEKPDTSMTGSQNP
jgi:hypothetical protein